MGTNAVALLGFILLFVLMLLRVPVGMAMGLVGVSGFAYLVNGDAALKIIGHTSLSALHRRVRNAGTAVRGDGADLHAVRQGARHLQ